MRKKSTRIIKCIWCIVLSLSVSVPAYAKTIAEIQKEQAETQKQLDKANDSISSIAEQKKGITEELDQLDDLLVEILTSVSLIEDEIEEKREQIEETKIEYDIAKENEEKQYEAMKIRLKYMYEHGSTESYTTLLIGSQGISDALNRSEYIEKIYEYDKNMLDEFVKAKEAVEKIKVQLEEEEAELLTSQYELEQEQAEMDVLIEEKKQQQKDFDTQLAKAKQEAATYKAKIKQQNAEIKKIQEEEARKAAAAAAASSNSSKSDVIKNASGSASGKEIANYACKFVGNPYVSGGTSLTNGADCSGFTMSVYKAFGYSIPRTSTAQRSAGKGVTYAEAQPGDIICYAGHVAIYIGGGQIVHASTPATGIKYGTATYKEILAVRRIV